MHENHILKALEVWTLQNLLNISILLGVVVAGARPSLQGYYRSLEKHLTLRVSIEMWRVATVLVVDVLLVAAVLVGLMMLNPDIMADIKMAVPFYPIAVVLFAAALVLRLFHGAHDAGSKNYVRAAVPDVAASLINIAGYTFVPRAGKDNSPPPHRPGLGLLRDHFRSNADPSAGNSRKPRSTSASRCSWPCSLGVLFRPEDRSKAARRELGHALGVGS